ncbi:hypothetical protein [Bartonella sp. CB189]
MNSLIANLEKALSAFSTGSNLVDGFLMCVAYEQPNRKPRKKLYQHSQQD